MKRANYICTINDSQNNVGKIERLIYKGMTVARINASHTNHDEMSRILGKIEAARERYIVRTHYYCNLAVALDLKGPEIRIKKLGKNYENEFVLRVDDKVRFSIDAKHEEKTPDDVVYVPNPNILDFLKTDHTVFINHGEIVMKVIDVIGYMFTCTVTNASCPLKLNQDIYIPDIYKFLNLKSVTNDDINDIKFAVENSFDFIIASNIECGLDIDEIKAHISNEHSVRILAKIQTKYAVDEIEEIAAKADGIIVAPSFEIENDLIPFVRSKALSVCKKKMKPCFLNVDRCLESCELYELVNWFIDSGDGVVLTRDSADGGNLVKNVEILEKINRELSTFEYERDTNFEYRDNLSVLAAISVTSSINTNASAIIVLSGSYSLTQFVYFHRPKCTIIPVSNNARVVRQLNIFNGVVPLFCNSECEDILFNFGLKFSILREIAKCGATVILLTEKYMHIHYVPYEKKRGNSKFKVQ